jgi:phosphatidylglycerophosphate synthase
MRAASAVLNAPNLVTAFRALIVLLLAALIAEPAASRMIVWMAVWGATLAAVLDGVDGWLARRSGMSTPFGARFDMETDALLILVLSILAWRWGKSGWWVLLSGVMRYAFVAAGWLLPWINRPLAPSRRGKTVAVVQMVVLIVAIGPIIPTPLSITVTALGLMLLTWSFALDVRRLWVARATS